MFYRTERASRFWKSANSASGFACLYVNDCTCDSVEIYDQTSMPLYAWPMGTPFGAIGGQPFFPFGDGDSPERDVDLDDFAAFQIAFTQGP